MTRAPRGTGPWNAGNSAARSHYRAERTNFFKRYRSQQSIRDRKEASLTREQVQNGRYRVARARNIKRKTASAIIATSAGIGITALAGATLPAAIVGAAASVPVAAIANVATGGFYYGRQTSAYGKRRAKADLKL